MNSNGDRILIVGPAWVGDMVMAHSLVQTLLHQNPQNRIDILAPSWSLPLVKRMPGINDAIAMPLGHGEFRWSVRRNLGIKLREFQYQRAIVIPRSFKAALVPFHADIPVRTGFRGESRYFLLNDIRKLDKKILDGTVKRYISLGLKAGASMPDDLPYPVLKIDTDNARRCMAEFGFTPEQHLIALMPGAEYGPAKQWPVQAFGQLAGKLCDDGHQVMILGSAKEQHLGASIVEQSSDRARNLCGKTTLEDAVDLLSCADAAVTNDSGLMHIAAAVGTGVTAIYGSSSPQFTPPLSHTKQVLYRNLDCSPCFKRVCPLGHTNCLHEISVPDVSAAVATFLD